MLRICLLFPLVPPLDLFRTELFQNWPTHPFGSEIVIADLTKRSAQHKLSGLLKLTRLIVRVQCSSGNIAKYYIYVYVSAGFLSP
jgi:hypothetical protein